MENCEDKASRRGRLNDGFKQRIVGALVLIALAVIFLPSLLDRESKGHISEVSQIPAEPDISPIEIAQPEPVAGVAPAPKAGEIFQPEVPEKFSNPAEGAAKFAVSDTQPEKGKDTNDSTSSVEVDTAKQAASPLVDDQGQPMAWVVQVASYKDDSRAQQLRMRLMDEGYRAYTRAVETDKGRFVRVFVGPKVNKADAQTIKRELDALLQAQTLVLRFKA
ncbi:SPOR domain-containing protein [Microbulbifer variabilis]|uniref:SPOR domain-containing protein n=1 Tax=Microbulbifer variabilis TaxID=266805 RepID=A0ABY4VEX9_9GAMM|nr:SPOR domain-containing protein [Microbulbifer variabilis]USD22816.1 SPOR domain-containing protein [Microbulbifer variabilis]